MLQLIINGIESGKFINCTKEEMNTKEELQNKFELFLWGEILADSKWLKLNEFWSCVATCEIDENGNASFLVWGDEDCLDIELGEVDLINL